MSYYSGLTPQSNYDPSANSIPFMGGNGAAPVATGVPAPSQSQAGQVRAPNSVLQNVNDFSGSLGTLGGNYNQDQGLRRYDALNSQYGSFGGQWTPFGLRSQGEGGLGRNDQDYFVNPNVSSFQAGRDYNIGQGGVQGRDIYRNAYTGGIDRYGAQRNYATPGGLAGSFDYGAMKAGVDPNPYDASFSHMNSKDLVAGLNGKADQLRAYDGKGVIDPRVAQYLQSLGMGQFDTGANSESIGNYARSQAQAQYQQWLDARLKQLQPQQYREYQKAGYPAYTMDRSIQQTGIGQGLRY